MKIASINELKQELTEIPASKVKDLCLRLARYKKENKELLTYLLFEAHDQNGYKQNVKLEIDSSFETLHKTNLHLTRKSLRKILRSIAKYSRHTGSAQSHIEMVIYFCFKLKGSGIPIRKSPALENLYSQQLKKCNKLLDGLHEDLRYDYARQLSMLEQINSPAKQLHPTMEASIRDGRKSTEYKNFIK